MEIPDRIKQALDGESIQSAVSLGDEDVICFTPTRTLLYRGEGLLSDETVETYSHDVERLNISEGRRKTTFALEYVDTVEKFKITSKRSDQVLARLMAGILGASGVFEEEESVAGVYRFSELTIIITESRFVKHVGAYVWDPDFEEYPYSDVTGLEFEDGSVATQIVISVSGRPQRIKAPTDEARKLQETLTNALTSYYDVQSLEALNEKIGETPDPEAESTATQGLGLDENISPLVGDADSDESDASTSETTTESASTADQDESAVADSGGTVVAESTGESSAAEVKSSGSEESSPKTGEPSVTAEEVEQLRSQLSKLTKAVEAQQEQLAEQSEQMENQREIIEQLIEELRRQT